jgi:hypothetical protein
MTGNDHVRFGGRPPQKYRPVEGTATRRRPTHLIAPQDLTASRTAAPPAGADCYLRMGFTAIESAPSIRRGRRG